MVHRKKPFIEKKSFFAVDYVKMIELHNCTDMTSHIDWVNEIADVMKSIKKNQ